MNNKNDIIKNIKDALLKILSFLLSKTGIALTGIFLMLLIASLIIGALTNDAGKIANESESDSSSIETSAPESEIVTPQIDIEPEEPVSTALSTGEKRLTLSQIDIPDTSWAYFLINRSNSLPSGYEDSLEFKSVWSNGANYYFDSRVADFAQCMINDAEDEGVTLLICSAYRSLSRQTANFENRLRSYAYAKYSFSRAYELTSGYIAIPGTSEHQTGLAVDFITPGYMYLDDGFEDTDAYKWLVENSYKYGFILRYPSDKSELTGINYEPWHFRFIGFEHAEKIYESGLCLEEYMERESENHPNVTFNKLGALQIPAEPAWYNLILNPPVTESESNSETESDSTYDSDSDETDSDNEDELPEWLRPTEPDPESDTESENTDNEYDSGLDEGADTDSDIDTDVESGSTDESESGFEYDSAIYESKTKEDIQETDSDSYSEDLTEDESETETDTTYETTEQTESEAEIINEAESEHEEII